MGILQGVLGGVIGAEMTSVVSGLIEQHGGVQGLISHLQQQGLGNEVKSWIGSGPNQPISASQVHQAFGADTLQQLASKAGMNPQDLTQKLSQTLPQVIDKLSPGGIIQNA